MRARVLVGEGRLLPDNRSPLARKQHRHDGRGLFNIEHRPKLVIVGNFLDSRYQSEIHSLITHYRGCDRLTFTGALYGRDALSKLHQHCFAHLYGHSSGGTNPSLLEATIAHAGIILAYEISTIAKYSTASRCSSTTHRFPRRQTSMMASKSFASFDP